MLLPKVLGQLSDGMMCGYKKGESLLVCYFELRTRARPECGPPAAPIV